VIITFVGNNDNISVIRVKYFGERPRFLAGTGVKPEDEKF
jgi:hypothetical protein